MNRSQGADTSNMLLLILGVASLFLYPFTAIPGIIIGRRQQPLTSYAKVGYVLCWFAMIVFCIHLSALALILFKQSSM